MSALSRYERGDWPIRKGDVTALLDLYGFHDAAERDRMHRLAEEIWRTDRWDEDYGDVVDASFIQYPWLEARAAAISSYNPMLLPGLLQTREYAEAVIRNAEPVDTPEPTITRYIRLRMERQQLLDDQHGPIISSVLDELVLRRPVGAAAVVRSQLHHLLELAKRPRVSLRVLPSQVGLHAGLEGAFILFTMPQPYPAVAYVESLGGRLYIEAPKSDRFVRAYDRLRQAALDEHGSARLIASIAEELS